MSFRPMLFPIDDPVKNLKFFDFFQFPMWGFEKVDGIRGSTPRFHGVDSRSGKPIPSKQVQKKFGLAKGLDGELSAEVAYNTPGLYNITQSFVMSGDKPSDLLEFNVFDCILEEVFDLPYWKRFEHMRKIVASYDNPDIRILEPTELENLDELLAYEQKCLAAGFEGIIARSPIGVYKNGRCTMRESNGYKVKRFQDLEGVVVGFYEAMINTNAQEEDELGYTKRSGAKEGLVPADTLGGFFVHFGDGIPIERVGCGAFNHKERKYIWCRRDGTEFLGQLLKVRRFAHGAKDKSRQARAVGFRSKLDL